MLGVVERHNTDQRASSPSFPDFIVQHYPELDALTRTVTFQVTEKCSLACTYCYQTNKTTKRMTFDIAKRMVDNILSGKNGFGEYLQSIDSLIIEFIGGEPLLEVDLIDQIIDYFQEQIILQDAPCKYRYFFSICSNGIAYNEPKVQKFLQKHQNVLSFTISIDGVKELHDSCRVFADGSPSYDIAHTNALNWKNRGNYMGSKMTLAPENIKYFSDSLKQMVQEDYVSIFANCVYEDVWSIEDAQELYRQCKEFSDWMRRNDYNQDTYDINFFSYEYARPAQQSNNTNWCGGTGYMLACDPDGNLFPCIRYMKTSLGDTQQPYCIGNVWDGIQFDETTKKRVNCLACITRRSQSTDDCYYCPIAQGCGWCSGYNYQLYGTSDKRSTAACIMKKAQSLAIVYYWNQYYYKTNQFDKVHDLWVPRQWAIPIIGEEEYNHLVEITAAMGGHINETQTQIRDYQEKV